MGEIGAASLRFALLVAVFGSGAAVYAGVKRRADWTRVSERALTFVFVLISAAMVCLFAAFGLDDFRLEYVASHSARSMELPYKLAAVWGGQAVRERIDGDVALAQLEVEMRPTGS